MKPEIDKEMGKEMNKSIIEINNVSHTYKSGDIENTIEALSNINITIKEGSFVVILGRNGSGKSTLAKLINALILPTEGSVLVNGMDTKDSRYTWEIRRTVGMVFQNPDNQIIGTTVEEDVAFGPENLGVPPAEIVKRVKSSLKVVGLTEFCESAPHLLSGGQKQRVAIAGVLAMRPKCIVLDEATSMLDPIGRKEVMNILQKLNKEEKITIIHITHNMDEAFAAERVVVINNGIIEADGTPKEIFSDVEKIRELGLDVPQVTELLNELEKYGYILPKGILTVDEAYDILWPLLVKSK
jgi:energy-coupling factor transport system ATP-binding protein